MSTEANPQTDNPYQLLVVDDAEGMRETLALRLEREGYRVSRAASGAEALALAAARNFDLILLDIRLPGMNGFDLLAALRRSRSILDTPIIVLSGLGETEDVVRALKHGANDYVTKPFDVPVMLARIRTQLSLKRLKELHDRFLRIATHDLKKPLLLMLDATRVIRNERPPGAVLKDEDHETLDLVIKTGEYMQAVIEDLLELRSIKDGHIRLALAAVDLNAIAHRVGARNADYAQRKGIALVEEPAAALPAARGDDARLTEVLDNLIGNAIKFCTAGATVTVRTVAAPDSVTFEVSDTGPGIPADEMDKLFVAYAGLTNRPTAGEHSTGLGLSICKELIGLHGGDIGARNNPDGGATFWFRLPVARAE